VPYVNFSWVKADGGRTRYWNMSPEIDWKAFDRFSSSLSLNYSRNVDDSQWYGNFDNAGALHYTFAHLDQTTTSLTARLNYTFTRDLSLQTYLQPFVTKGSYSNVREMSSTPRADNYEDRYTPYLDPAVTDNPGGFNFKQLQSNVVLRWEYNPGSTLFVVWNQGRQGSGLFDGEKRFQTDVRDLFRLHPANTFLIKVSYWLNR
jgi:hypothetical protein